MTRKRRRLPLHVEANVVKGKVYLSFRLRSQNGPRIRLRCTDVTPFGGANPANKGAVNE